MSDYIYLLENRLSADQRNALFQLREAARNAGMILFLTGDAVRDLTSGHAVRELEVAVHGNALKLKKPIAKLGGKVWGEDEASRSLYLCFPGTVRVDVVSTHRAEYPKPGKPVFHPASILEFLHRRDFTMNAMAISLNEGSFGLLMDPLNGVADIESRTLRLVSGYGFLDDPSLLIRATRYRARLGWELDPRTMSRYENAKSEGMIESISSHARSRELEQIGHEEDGLKVLRALESEGWVKVLFPVWTSAKADEQRLQALHELGLELLMQGVHADMSAAQMQLLTAKLAPKDLRALKKLMLRPGFVEEWNSLDALAANFAKTLLAKQNATPSAGFKLFTSYDPEAVLWLGFTSKAQAVLDRYNLFLRVWPEARQRIPYSLMQEMRITPELPNYGEIVQAIFLELIDGRLTTPEEMRAFLEPYSPPAPPPPMTMRRTRAKRGAVAKLKEETFDEEEEEEESLGAEDELEAAGEDEDESELGLSVPKADVGAGTGEETESEEEYGEHEAGEEEPAPAAVAAVEKPSARKARIPARREAVTPPAAASGTKAAKASKVRPASVPKPAPAAPAKKAAAKPAVSAAKAKQVSAPARAKAPAATKKKAVPVPSPVKGKKASPPAVKRPSAAPAHAKQPRRAPAKVAAKAASRTAAKAAKGTAAKGAPVKSAGSKKKPARAAAAKPGKAPKRAKPSAPSKKAAKKPALKTAKKR